MAHNWPNYPYQSHRRDIVSPARWYCGREQWVLSYRSSETPVANLARHDGLLAREISRGNPWITRVFLITPTGIPSPPFLRILRDAVRVVEIKCSWEEAFAILQVAPQIQVVVAMGQFFPGTRGNTEVIANHPMLQKFYGYYPYAQVAGRINEICEWALQTLIACRLRVFVVDFEYAMWIFTPPSNHREWTQACILHPTIEYAKLFDLIEARTKVAALHMQKWSARIMGCYLWGEWNEWA